MFEQSLDHLGTDLIRISSGEHQQHITWLQIGK
jgi:hypothetical protein